jgi:threonine synthase
MKWFYRCPTCGAEYAIEPGRYLCGPCASKRMPDRPLEGVLECAWHGEASPEWLSGPGLRGAAANTADRAPLPVERTWFPPIPVGNTPLWAPERLRTELGFPRLFLKDDTCQPSGSFKDRASLLVAAFARKFGIREIALASTGNAASSMAAIGATAGLKITVFLPRSAPAAKRIQVVQYGAELRQVEGNYDRAFEESLAYSERTGVLSRNTAWNPLTIEGKKTVSFEIVSDLAAAGAPTDGSDLEIFVPAGDGVILAGVYKGFEDLVRLGRLARVPRVWACQADGSSAIARALAAGDFGAPLASDTLADSISVDVPRNGAHALAKLKKYDGRAVIVSDEEILAAQHELAAGSGLFAEPSSSAAWAGFLKAGPGLSPASTVVLLITGSGLKDIRSAARGVGLPA